MRTLDYYVGVPLCLFGTLIKKLCDLFPAPRQEKPCRNVLFIGLSETGSIILAGPAMNKMKNALNVNLFFVSFENNSRVLEFMGTVPQEHVFRMRNSGIWSLAFDALRFIYWTRGKRIDTVIDLELFSRFTALLAGLSGAVRKAGFHAFFNEGLYRGDFLTHKVAYNPHMHISKNFIALINAVLSEKQETPYSKSIISDDEIQIGSILLSEQAKISMRHRISKDFPEFDDQYHKIVLFNTNSSDLVPLRRWPKGYFVSLAKKIIEQFPHIVILLTGIESEITWNDRIVLAVGDERCVNFAGKTSLSDLPVLYSISGFMVTNDSGPAHFASVTSMPTFVFFGPETPDLYGPLGDSTPIYAGLACSPCVSAANHRKSACDDNVCLKNISPEMVFQIIRPRFDAI